MEEIKNKLENLLQNKYFKNQKFSLSDFEDIYENPKIY